MPEKDNRIFDIIPREKENNDETKGSDYLPVINDYQEVDNQADELITEERGFADFSNDPAEDEIITFEEDEPNNVYDEELPEEAEDEIIKLEWDAPDREEFEHRLPYFLIVGIIAIALLVYSAFRKDLIGAIFLVVICIAFVFYKIQKPKNYHYALSNYGLSIDDKFYDYSEMHSFWVIKTKDRQFLHVIFNKKYFPQLTINTSSIEIGIVRSVLHKYLPEQENVSEPIVDKIVRLLKL